jgi:hypothetical protein
MDDDSPQKQYPLSASKMSKTPSWIMLGFVLGALFVIALRPPPPKPVPGPAPVAVEPAKPSAPRDPPQLSRIEIVFEKYGEGAVWSDNTTEVAMWDPTEERYADFYEVRRIDGKLYFRSIPQLTRRIIARGKTTSDALLQFTETEEQFREWEQFGRTERPIERMWQKPARSPSISVPPPTAPSMETPKLDLAPPSINPALPAPQKKDEPAPGK